MLKRSTQALAEQLTVSSADSKSTRAVKNQKFTALLAPDFVGTLELNHFNEEIDYDEATTGHQYLTQSCESSQTSITDIEIISITDSSASITAVFEMSVSIKGGRTYSEPASASMTWKKTDGNLWKLERLILK